MNEILYRNLNWGLLEGVRYSDIDNPSDVLGPHIYEKKLCVTAFLPNATKVEVMFPDDNDKTFLAEEVDEAVFAAVTDYKSFKPYLLKITYGDNYIVREDAYAFKPNIPTKILDDFASGDCINIYEYLGAIPTKINNTNGVIFSVWAPMAQRVSVVGDFNLWDGRANQMSRIHSNGVFTIFVPDIQIGSVYKYEIRTLNGDVILKADPYARQSELRPHTASIVAQSTYTWNDKAWLASRKNIKSEKEPLNIYELHLGSFMTPDDGREFYNYREYASLVVDYIKKMHYTHVEIMPIMEYPYDKSWGYQVTGYYAPTSRYGTPDDFKYFVDYLHKNGISIILDWVPAHFPKDACGLARFDGSCVYEHLDKRQGEHPHWGTLIFNYGRPEVSNFLIANAMYWLSEFHIDGLRVDAVASMLYLDYGKNDGEWVANKYGGHENLEAIEFMRKLNATVDSKLKGRLIIAEESTAWPKVTDSPKNKGLGFSYKWNMGWMNDFLGYIKYDPIYRSKHQLELTFSLSYTFSENYILVLSHDEVVHLKGSMLNKMPGELNQKFANLRLTFGFMMTHPGKKLRFMGQDIGQPSEWAEDRQISWEVLEHPENQSLQAFVKDLNKLYLDNPALYYNDSNKRGFSWINGSYDNESLLFFIRKATKKTDALIIALNFTPVIRKRFRIGVPYRGAYKEIINSDSKKYGGSGITNRGQLITSTDKWDGFTQSIELNVPPLGISILKYEGAAKEPATNAKKTQTKKTDSVAKKSTSKSNKKIAAKKTTKMIKNKPINNITTLKKAK